MMSFIQSSSKGNQAWVSMFGLTVDRLVVAPTEIKSVSDVKEVTRIENNRQL